MERGGTGTIGASFFSCEARCAKADLAGRYSWLRDSSFSVYALLRLGFTEEADRASVFRVWRLG